MTRLGTFVLRLLGLAALVAPLVSGLPLLRRGGSSPLADPFYTPPAGFESTAPGTILKQRSITASFFGLIPDLVEAHQLLYRTTAINGSAIATVTTVFKPLLYYTDRFVSYHTAYDSSSPSCEPSYNFGLGSPQTNLISSSEMLLIQVYLTLGYIVASPDYEGPDAAFAVGQLEGMGVLDGMRAVVNYKSTLGLSSNPMIVGVGYSGGAIATGWAAALQSTYGSGLNIKGWSAGGTPANLTGTAVLIDGTVFAGFLPAAIAGLAKPSAYGASLDPLLNSVVTTAGAAAIQFANNNCAVEDLLYFAGQSVQSTKISSLGSQLLYDPTVAGVLDQCILGVNSTLTPTSPVFLYHATQDEIIPYQNASTLYSAWCKNGANVKFTTLASGGHGTSAIIALPDVIAFVQSAFAETVASGCSTSTEYSSTLNPLALGLDIEPILVELIDVILTLGLADINLINDITLLKKTPLRPLLDRRGGSNPLTDAFYTPPSGYASTAPGTILNQRSITASFFGLIPDTVEAHQLLFRTNAVNGTAIAAVTTVFKPSSPYTDRFVTYHTAYDSASAVCDPSYNYELGSTQTNLFSSAETLIVQTWLSLGYIVNSPDYEGPEGAFGAGRLEGMVVLDSLRAVINFRSTVGLSSNPMIVGTGYSGGAIGAGWAASLQSTYAPELNVKGWAVGGIPANLTGTTVYLDGTVFSGYLPAAIAGLSKPSAYGASLVPFFEGILTTAGTADIEYAETHCQLSDLLNFAGQSIQSSEVQTLGDGLLYAPTFASVLNQQIMGTNATLTPTAPVFMYHATQDEVIPYQNASSLYDAWCKNGASVQLSTFAAGGHVTTVILGLVDVISFAAKAFAGTVATGCSKTTEYNTTVNALALGLDIEPILATLVDVILTVGEGDANLLNDLSLLEKIF
ncbi:hypothetical protein HK405_007751 [Cladochytrium tenue]|nr:hypothetical protein HK405_007751 [Cladochytrium tenue]